MVKEGWQAHLTSPVISAPKSLNLRCELLKVPSYSALQMPIVRELQVPDFVSASNNHLASPVEHTMLPGWCGFQLQLSIAPLTAMPT